MQESLIIGVAIYPDFDWLSGAYIKPSLEYLLFTLSPYRFEQFIDQTKLCVNKAFIHQVKIIDPSMLYMASLLRTEIEYPKPLSQQFASSLTAVILTHCLLQIPSDSRLLKVGNLVCTITHDCGFFVSIAEILMNAEHFVVYNAIANILTKYWCSSKKLWEMCYITLRCSTMCICAVEC
ncbi:hypothetical protein NIES4071_78910 [Calothrix sp. NIES-4071]|nr:hypothetical protein NIES4071_78910 [Calothrix sp. NIES-4071]BAZ62163.1 hypothetical protein NIES4105_78840 [Calothrix sp. NIES-4105]